MTSRRLKLTRFFSSLRSSLPKLRSSFNHKLRRHPKKYLPLSLVVISAAVIVILVGKTLTRLSRSSSPPSVASSDSRVSVLGAKAFTNLNKDFSFPLKDSSGKKLTDVKFLLESAELRDEIIVKGKRATAVQGRTFLIINLKITSSYPRTLNVNTQDYFRLTLNGKTEEMLAPDIHNDPVAIQPISTKYTRLGFPINDTDKNLALLVGEVAGEKTKVELNLQ
ncbi:hypothetical protein HYS82_02280 [Candidatus Amesbacteria bacterium]|nr:hypothetical protein [Candidatus Amesbacteria bacterium]